MHTYLSADVNECESISNGGCHIKRKCINTPGSRECLECESGWVNEGKTGCKGVCSLDKNRVRVSVSVRVRVSVSVNECECDLKAG